MNPDFFWFCFLIASSPSLGWWWENSDPQKVDINTLISALTLCFFFLLKLILTLFMD